MKKFLFMAVVVLCAAMSSCNYFSSKSQDSNVDTVAVDSVVVVDTVAVDTVATEVVAE